MVLAVINNKGGTGKTTSAVSLGAGLALKGRRTLLIGLDAQASASLSLGVDRADFKPSAADVILAGRGLFGLIRKTGAEGLDLITGSPDLANADLQLAKTAGRERRLKDALAPVRALVAGLMGSELDLSDFRTEEDIAADIQKHLKD